MALAYLHILLSAILCALFVWRRAGKEFKCSWYTPAHTYTDRTISDFIEAEDMIEVETMRGERREEASGIGGGPRRTGTVS